MPQIPNLRESNLRHCIVCVQLPSSIEIDEPLNLRQPVTGGGFECVLVMSHCEDDSNTSFLHVEMAIPEWFDGDPPKKSGQKRVFDKQVNEHVGKECEARITGTFRVKLASLASDSFIRTASKPSGVQGLVTHMRSASLDIQGAPFTSLQWLFVREEVRDEPSVSITIKGKTSLKLSNEYLSDAIEFLKSGFSLLVVGTNNEPSNV